MRIVHVDERVANSCIARCGAGPAGGCGLASAADMVRQQNTRVGYPDEDWIRSGNGMGF